MDEPFDNNFDFSMSEQYVQAFGSRETSHGDSYPRIMGPPTHFDGVAFWYRPEHGQHIYGRNNAGFEQNVVAVPNEPESAVSVKHRRTRSGCFTCRARRVKVSLQYRLPTI